MGVDTMTTTTTTIEATESAIKLASLALQIQDACNGYAITNAILAAQHADGGHTGDIGNQHPARIMLIDKLASLGGCQQLGNDRVADAYGACFDLADGRDVEWTIHPIM
jgi:hypothetical protein